MNITAVGSRRSVADLGIKCTRVTGKNCFPSFTHCAGCMDRVLAILASAILSAEAGVGEARAVKLETFGGPATALCLVKRRGERSTGLRW